MLQSSNLFTGERIRLTAPRPEDAFTWERWYQDSEFTRLYDFRSAYPRPAARYRQILDEAEKNRDSFPFAIRPHYSEELIGLIDLDGIQWTHGSAWLGIAIGDAANRGQGYGREAMTLVLRFAFTELNLHRLNLTVFEYNTPAIRLYERLGFVREGVMREMLHRDGRRWDEYVYGLLNREWAAMPREK